MNADLAFWPIPAILCVAVVAATWMRRRTGELLREHRSLQALIPEPVLTCDGSGRVVDATFAPTIGDVRDCGQRHVNVTARSTGTGDAFLLVRDTSTQVGPQREVQSDERRFSALGDNVGEHALVLVEGDGNISTWNTVAEKLMGRTASDAVGRPIRDLFAEPTHVDQLLDDAAAAGDADRELALRDFTGNVLTLNCRVSVIRADDGQVRAFGCVIVDVTETRRMQRVLAESEERFRLLAEHARDGIYRLRLRPDLVHEYVNPAMVEITGTTAEELYADPDLPLRRVHADDRETVMKSRCCPDKVDWPLQIRWDRNGEWRHLSFTEVPVYDDAGTLVATEGFLVDVTEQRAREAALREAVAHQKAAIERLQHIDQLKTAFLQAVSHELRTPLSSVMGYAQTLHRRDGDLPLDTRRHLLERLDHNARRLGCLLGDLLDIDRLQRGIVEPNLSEADLRQVAANVIENLSAPRHLIEVVPSGNVTAVVDVGKVERIIENLVANAVRHTPAGTSVRVLLSRDEQALTLTVEDDGPGIDDQLLEDIFEPFRQGDDSLGRSSPGTGIGLSLVRQFARLHGGDAWATNRPGGGARFHISLPQTARKPSRAPQPA